MRKFLSVLLSLFLCCTLVAGNSQKKNKKKSSTSKEATSKNTTTTSKQAAKTTADEKKVAKPSPKWKPNARQREHYKLMCQNALLFRQNKLTPAISFKNSFGPVAEGCQEAIVTYQNSAQKLHDAANALFSEGKEERAQYLEKIAFEYDAIAKIAQKITRLYKQKDKNKILEAIQEYVQKEQRIHQLRAKTATRPWITVKEYEFLATRSSPTQK